MKIKQRETEPWKDSEFWVRWNGATHINHNHKWSLIIILVISFLLAMPIGSVLGVLIVKLLGL